MGQAVQPEGLSSRSQRVLGEREEWSEDEKEEKLFHIQAPGLTGMRGKTYLKGLGRSGC